MNHYYNSIKYGIKNVYNRKFKKYTRNPHSQRTREELVSFIQNIESDTVVVFAGLKQIKYYAGIDEPAAYLIDLLLDKFHNVIVPTYTASVKETLLYDVVKTPSESGAFSNAFLKVADCRTLSPFKSFAVWGPISDIIMNLQTDNDFANEGIFEFLHKKNIPSINIGSAQIRFKSLHYIEYLKEVPYLDTGYKQISIIDKNGQLQKKSCFNLSYKKNFKFNFDKLSNELLINNLIIEKDVDGLKLRYLTEDKYFPHLLNKVETDPFYLID
jgi:aminoglycoside N3'-acetyltransferase